METYGLIGKGIGHSFSPAYFQSKFIKFGRDAVYLLFEPETISNLRQFILKHNDIRGLNVTIPYKEAVIPFLDKLDATAKKVGAVNTIKIHRDKNKIRLIGFNTDVIGFREALIPLISESKTIRALILGTGGSAKAVSYVLANTGIPFLKVSRKPAPGILSYDDLDQQMVESHVLIVNCTPLGMFPDSGTKPEIPYRFISPKHILFDLVYNPPDTEFLKLGKAKGAKTEGGLKMLYRQAEASWLIWQSE